ncbi:hypothetical protein DFH28DRAFT_522590 [Melampsora americana]|nr:hypothetical protein DFH28DRAFT_522590 [Melampsora americana]
MIPPRFTSYLQQLITQKLLESSTFHELVQKTDHFARSIKQLAIEVIRDHERNTTEVNQSERSRPEECSKTFSDSSTTWKSTHTTSSEPNQSDTFSQSNQSNPKPEINERLETDRKFKEMLQKLRDQK